MCPEPAGGDKNLIFVTKQGYPGRNSGYKNEHQGRKINGKKEKVKFVFSKTQTDGRLSEASTSISLRER